MGLRVTQNQAARPKGPGRGHRCRDLVASASILLEGAEWPHGDPSHGTQGRSQIAPKRDRVGVNRARRPARRIPGRKRTGAWGGRGCCGSWRLDRWGTAGPLEAKGRGTLEATPVKNMGRESMGLRGSHGSGQLSAKCTWHPEQRAPLPEPCGERVCALSRRRDPDRRRAAAGLLQELLGPRCPGAGRWGALLPGEGVQVSLPR